jgi:hypothetical protein
MLKIAIAVMLLATSALATVDVTVTPSKLELLPGEQVALTISLINDENLPIMSYNVWPAGEEAKLAAVSKECLSTAITDPTYTLPSLTGKTLADIFDLGYTSADGSVETGVERASAPLSRWTFTAPMTLGPVVISFTGSTWYFDPDGIWLDPPPMTPTTITLHVIPEPASVVLLAAGAAVFARRRRLRGLS